MARRSDSDEPWVEGREWFRGFIKYHDPKERLDTIVRAEPDTIWVHHDPIYERWKFDPASRVLWITGPPGCGKSVIARHLVEEDLLPGLGTKLCYYFFSSDGKGLDNGIAGAARSILGQFLAADAETRILPTFKLSPEELSYGFLTPRNPSHDRAQTDRLAVTCVLDGPDVAVRTPEDLDGFRDFVEAMLVGDHGYDIKLLITCRPISSSLEASLPTLLVLRLEDHEAQFDQCLGSYLDRELGPSRKVARDALQGILSGSFLTAEAFVATIRGWRFDGLLHPDTDPRLAKLRETCPESLASIYSSSLSRWLGPGNLSMRIMAFLAIAVRPLSIEELVAVVCSGESEAERVRQIIDCRCQGLITFTSENDLTIVRSFCIARFLPSYETRGLDGLDDLGAGAEWHREMAERCMDCIGSLAPSGLESSSNLTSGQTFRPGPHASCARHPFLGYAARYWSYHSNSAPGVSTLFLPPLPGETGGRIVFRNKERRKTEDMPKFWQRVLNLCKPTSPSVKIWFPLYWTMTHPSEPLPEDLVVGFLVSEFVVASYLDAGRVMEVMASFGTSLVRKEQDIASIRDRNGQTALHLASNYGCLQAVKTLCRICKESSTVNLPDDEGRTPLHLAAKNRHGQVVELLLRISVTNFNAIDNKGQTPLHYAAQWGDGMITEALLDANATVDVEDHHNNTPRMCAYNALEELQNGYLRDPGNSSLKEIDERAWVHHLLEKTEIAGTGLSDNLDPRTSRADRAFNIDAVSFGPSFSSRSSSQFSVESFLKGAGRGWLKEKAGEPRWLHIPANNVSVNLSTLSGTLPADRVTVDVVG